MSGPVALPEALLGGRVLLDQLGAGLRATIEPVLLAAAIPARAGEAVLEAGTGIGTASLCLLARVADVRAVGIEHDLAQAAGAEANAARNGWGERFATIGGDVADRATARAAAARGPYQHAMANPPWFAGGTLPDTEARRAAKHADGSVPLTAWVSLLTRRVVPRGTVTLILPACLLPEAFASFAAARLGEALVFPLWRRAGEEARRVILSGRKGALGPSRLLPGLVLHRADGRFTAEAEAVLRDAAALTLA